MPLVGGHLTGVYEIVNLVDGKWYVGGAYKSLDLRRRIHWRDLRAGRHNNQHLQNAWNTYGENSFSFNILEYCSPELVGDRETYWIAQRDAVNRQCGYNKSPTGGSPLGTKHTEEYCARCSERNRNRGPDTLAKIGNSRRGKKHTAESRAKISAAHKGKPLTEEHKAKIAIAKTGKKHSSETRARIAEANKNRVITPDLHARLAEAGRIGGLTGKGTAAMKLANTGKRRPPELVARIAEAIRQTYRKRREAERAGH